MDLTIALQKLRLARDEQEDASRAFEDAAQEINEQEALDRSWLLQHPRASPAE